MHTATSSSSTRTSSDSPLWNPDLAPTPLSQRTWSTYHIAALWIGMSVVITTYTLASGLMQQGMTWWQAMVTILLGNTIVLVPMILNAHAGTKYGVSFPVLCRASFGVRGANVPAILRALVACGWFGIQTWIGGLALNTLLAAAWPAWARLRRHHDLDLVRRCSGWCRSRSSSAASRASRSWRAGRRRCSSAGGALLLMWAVRRGGGLGHILAESSRLQTAHVPFWQLFPAALTANVGYWATLSLNIPDFTRYAHSQRSQALGQALGLPATMTAFAFIGVAVTSATIVIFGEAIWDPVALIARIGSPLVIIFGALVVLIAQLTTNMAANVVSPANDFSSLAPRRISYVTGGLITAVLGIVMMPWKLYADAAAYIFTWLVGYSSLMGAIGGVLIADYWILRRRQLSLGDLFKVNGRYSYSNGVNRRAIVALVVAVLPVVPGFLRAATTPGGVVSDPGFIDTLYTYAWFVTFVLSGVVYLGLMRWSTGDDGDTGSQKRSNGDQRSKRRRGSGWTASGPRGDRSKAGASDRRWTHHPRALRAPEHQSDSLRSLRCFVFEIRYLRHLRSLDAFELRSPRCLPGSASSPSATSTSSSTGRARSNSGYGMRRHWAGKASSTTTAGSAASSRRTSIRSSAPWTRPARSPR